MKSKELSGRGGMKLVKSYERVYELEISTMLLKISFYYDGEKLKVRELSYIKKVYYIL